jgi:septum formation protein
VRARVFSGETAGRQLVLASSSPRRRELLEEAGYEFVVVPSRAAERPPASAEKAEGYALELARLKAEDVAGLLARDGRQKSVVLAADTVVDLEGEIIGQPASDDEARAMLRLLAGSRQAVVTAVVLVEVGTGRTSAAVERTELEMAALSEEEIEAYVASGESRGKAGAYAIQESGDRFVRILAGSRTNVVGLPMERLAAMLRDFAPELLLRRGEGKQDA